MKLPLIEHQLLTISKYSLLEKRKCFRLAMIIQTNNLSGQERPVTTFRLQTIRDV